MNYKLYLLEMRIVLLFATLLAEYGLSESIEAYTLQNQNILKDFSSGYKRSQGTPPRCGESLTSVGHGISYKPFEEVMEHERCVWILGVPQAQGYDINLLYLGSPTNKPGSGQGLLITGAFHGNSNPLRLDTFAPDVPAQFRVQDSEVVVITFYSSETNDGPNNGFILQYEAQLVGNYSGIYPETTHHIYLAPILEVKYPPDRENLSDYELATIALPPSNNIYAGNYLYAIFDLFGVDRYCGADLNLFTLNIDAAENSAKWVSHGRYVRRIFSVSGKGTIEIKEQNFDLI